MAGAVEPSFFGGRVDRCSFSVNCSSSIRWFGISLRLSSLTFHSGITLQRVARASNSEMFIAIITLPEQSFGVEEVSRGMF